MAKTSRTTQPRGEKISVGPEQRAWFKAQREARGIDQKVLAGRVGASQATISNLESGRHPQISKTLYAKLVRLFGQPEGTTEVDQTFRELVDDLAPLGEANLKAVRDLVKALRNAENKSR
jgi:transcriptional regulator with XRE-family HTH domain